MDNGSTEIVTAKFEKDFPQIRVIRNPQNYGFARGNNIGIKYARGEYCLLLNSDCELFNNAIDLAYKKMEGKKEIGALSGKLITPLGERQLVSGSLPSIKKEIFGIIGTLGISRLNDKYEKLIINDIEHETEFVVGAFMMLRKNVIEQFPEGKLNEDFFMYYEDLQWCHQIKKLGYKILYYPEAVIVHHGGSSSTIQLIEENMWVNSVKFMKIVKGQFYSYLYYLLVIIRSYLNKNEVPVGKVLNLLFKPTYPQEK